MIEDKLTHAQRVRLECIAQANVTIQGRPASQLASAALGDSVVKLARQYEAFVLGVLGTTEGQG